METKEFSVSVGSFVFDKEGIVYVVNHVDDKTVSFHNLNFQLGLIPITLKKRVFTKRGFKVLENDSPEIKTYLNYLSVMGYKVVDGKTVDSEGNPPKLEISGKFLKVLCYKGFIGTKLFIIEYLIFLIFTVISTSIFPSLRLGVNWFVDNFVAALFITLLSYASMFVYQRVRKTVFLIKSK